MSVFEEEVQKLWNEWEIRVLIVLSLVLQILLIYFGGFRKYSAKNWVRVILWLSYLGADAVAITALGALSHSEEKPETSQITAMWAPFLLVHLGGPDTITAYSLEDNELWLRHFLGLVQEFGIAIYVTVRSWAFTKISILTVLMFIPGLVKYGERTWVLRRSSKKNFRDSILGKADAGPEYYQFMVDYDAKQAKGYRVTVGRIEDYTLDNKDPSNAQGAGDESDLSEEEIMSEARRFFEKFRSLFADLILSADDWKETKEFFQNKSPRTAFKMIEAELGFVYDLLYSKAPLIYSHQGLILRCISLSSILTLFVVFVLGDDHHYRHVDRTLVYLLFIGALVLEIYAFHILIFSDWAYLWLQKHQEEKQKQRIPEKVFNWMTKAMASRKRWSNTAAQYNFISVCVKDKRPRPPSWLPGFVKTVLNKLQIDKLIEDCLYVSPKEILFKSKELIFKELQRSARKVETVEDVRNFCSRRGEGVLESNGHLRGKLQWSLSDVEFDRSILLWHIATDLCYQCDDNVSSFTELQRETSKLLSDYMLYLLMMCPFMLPEGIGQIRFRDTRAEIAHVLQVTKIRFDKIKLCEKLISVNTDILPAEIKGDKCKSVLFDACRLAKILQSLEGDKLDKWEIMSTVWIEMLCFAAGKCRGSIHCHQLGRGGEFISHIWLLMAHLGIAELFQISQGHVKAMLISG